MPRWLIPVTIVEYGRHVIVEAESKTEALGKFRDRNWAEQTDAASWKVTKVGAIAREE